MTSPCPIDNENIDNMVDSSVHFDNYEDNLQEEYYFYDHFSEQSVYSEPKISKRDCRKLDRLSTLSKEGQILIHREVPLKLRETVGRKYIKIPVYESSMTPNHRIKNAITGCSTPHRVGSKGESLYFKVCWATGVEGRREPINLFFETPIEFEKHFLVTLSDDVKEKWAERYRIVERAYIAENQEKNKMHMQRFTFIH